MIYLHLYFQNLVDYKVICWLYYSLFQMLLMPRKTTSKVICTLVILMKKMTTKIMLSSNLRKMKRNRSPQIGGCWLKKVWVVREWVANYHFLHTNWIFRSKRNTETLSLWSKKNKRIQAAASNKQAAPLSSLSSCLQEGDSGRITLMVSPKATKRSSPGHLSYF